MFHRKHLFNWLVLIGLAFIFLGAPITAGAQEFTYVPLENVPGFENKPTDLPTYIKSIYSLALWLVGLCALLMLTIGGFMYLSSAGNTASLGAAKNVITDALIGLTLALTAYLLLYVINPDLVNVNLGALNLSITSP